MLQSLFMGALAEQAEETVIPEVVPNWFQTAFKKIGEIPDSLWITLFALLLVGIGLLVLNKQKGKWTVTMLAFASLCVALAFVLGNIRIYRMPQGGSITPASMLPLLLFAYSFGVAPGILAGCVYGILDFLMSGGIIVNFGAFLLDYIIGFGVIGLAGLFSKVKKGLYYAIPIACMLRFIASVLSGILFYAEYAQGSGYSPFVYSIVYNGSYMLPEMLICLALSLAIAPRVLPLIKGKRVIKA